MHQPDDEAENHSSAAGEQQVAARTKSPRKAWKPLSKTRGKRGAWRGKQPENGGGDAPGD